jgi:AraC-like DNA-binding protein
MTLVFDTAKLPPPQREQVVRESVAAAVVPMNARFQCAPEEVRYRLKDWQLGRAHLIRSGGFGGLHLGFTQRLARQHGAELVTVGFQLQGSGFHTQNGHTQHKAPGGMAVLEYTLPFEAGVSESSSSGIIVIPAADLALPSDMIRRAAPMLATSPVHSLLWQHLARLSRDADRITQRGDAAMVGRATIELVRALVSSAGRDPGGNDTWNQTLETRLVTYIEQHLTDPCLRAEQLAREHDISVRQLYKLWSRHETSLSQWIIHKRLEGARAELSAADNDDATIGAVARRWGFINMTHFSRRFREVHGMSPREWRQGQCRMAQTTA